MTYYYEGEDFALVGIEKESYIENMHEWSDNDEVTHYMVTGSRPASRDKLAVEYESLISGENVVLTVIDKKSKRPCGFVGLYGINWQARHAEFRILIGDPKVQGKGIGTAITAWVVKYAFTRLNLNKVWLGVNTENVAAVRCYEKAGFAAEGTLRQEIYRNGRYYDAQRMSIIRSEHEKKA